MLKKMTLALLALIAAQSAAVTLSHEVDADGDSNDVADASNDDNAADMENENAEDENAVDGDNDDSGD